MNLGTRRTLGKLVDWEKIENGLTLVFLGNEIFFGKTSGWMKYLFQKSFLEFSGLNLSESKFYIGYK